MKNARGQVLVLFALALTVLIGFSALVVDIGLKYSSERRYQAVADAASLAGAQDLQARTPNSNDQKLARKHALQAVVDELIGAGATSTCDPGAEIVNCPLQSGSQFQVTIRTPSPNCEDCIAERSVQVTVREPAHGTYFARIFGQNTWNLARTSVAGPTLSASFAFVTLRPPNISGHSPVDANANDLWLAGNNTNVNVLSGDIGVNAYVVTNAASRVRLDPGYFIFHWDAGPVGTVDSWNSNSGSPKGQKLGSLIPEPAGYDYRALYATVPAVAPATGIDTAASCLTATSGLTFPTKAGDTVTPATLTCLKPGTYGGARVRITSPTYLEPGVFVFTNGLDINDYFYGGIGGSAVTIVMQGGNLTAGNAKGIFLNTPAPVAPASIGGTPIASPDGHPLSIVVRTVDSCFIAGTSPRKVSATACNTSSGPSTSVIQMDGSTGGSAGGPWINLGGVVWAPTDNVQIGSNFLEHDANVAQIVAWSIKYNGGATLNMVSVSNQSPGPIRIDTACSPGEPQATCN